MLLSIFGPLFIAADVAAVSSQCDKLYQRINSLRLHKQDIPSEADAVHSKTFPLLFTLERLNNRQGLGFLVWGKGNLPSFVCAATLNTVHTLIWHHSYVLNMFWAPCFLNTSCMHTVATMFFNFTSNWKVRECSMGML